MKKPEMKYYSSSDIIHLIISDERESDSVEINPNITAELNEKGEVIGIEITGASSFLRDSILETAQAKLLNIYHSHKYENMETA
jgi:uncharacterized protein YuzE